jgi:hypothetical protein
MKRSRTPSLFKKKFIQFNKIILVLTLPKQTLYKHH